MTSRQPTFWHRSSIMLQGEICRAHQSYGGMFITSGIINTKGAGCQGCHERQSGA
ncbi:MAG: hypothetical protein ACLUD2_12405 [Clostridium sp.]